MKRILYGLKPVHKFLFTHLATTNNVDILHLHKIMCSQLLHDGFCDVFFYAKVEGDFQFICLNNTDRPRGTTGRGENLGKFHFKWND